MLNKRSESDLKNWAIPFESENLGYDCVRSTHLIERRRLAGAVRRGLRRRDLSPDTIARFHEKYIKTPSGCWLWTAGKYRAGYGQIHLGRSAEGVQRVMQAHRVAYVLATGRDIPAHLVVMHSCDVRACVNPAHLSMGEQAENVRDGARKGRYNVPHVRARKLTDADVRAIRASNEKSVRLAVRYKTTLANISLIRRGLRRKAA